MTAEILSAQSRNIQHLHGLRESVGNEHLSAFYLYVFTIFVHKSTKRAKSDKKKDMFPLSYQYRIVQLLILFGSLVGCLSSGPFWTLAILHSAACYIKVSRFHVMRTRIRIVYGQST